MRFVIVPTLLLCLLSASAFGQSATKANASREELVKRGIAYLLERGQNEAGAFSPQTGAAVTGLVVTAILNNEPNAVADPRVQKALKYLESHIQKDGGICAPDSKYKNYETCVALTAFLAANKDGKYADVIKRAEAFIKDQQWDENESIDQGDPRYGGAGYGSKARPDLSNTGFFLEALHELGRDENDPAIQKALLFVSRTQNLESASNNTPFANKVNDGGFYYTPAAGGQSMAGQNADGGLRSYGSMTYAGLKSMIYAGLTSEDPRVKAALKFIAANYSVTENPGMGQAGLYYYYQTFAKAMSAAKVDKFKDAQGTEHDWRREIISALAERQQQDGSWTNGESDRWMESDPSLVTGYALLALAHCK